ncbi:developmentally-regulated protein [Acrasis kona]|uniref:Developmentally-regulated protein n=1 Tax=Acrasis kona TaxID=1008807 RepID=A0AAW2YKL4_9EUKA
MTEIDNISFNELVGHALVVHSTILPEQLAILDNSSKYRPEGIKQNVNDEESLSAIFDTMSNINRMAIEDDHLCTGKNGPSFRQALKLTTTKLAALVEGRQVRYVELGPEPWKSCTILTQLFEAGIDLQQYIGVDINPKSEDTMRKALTPIIGADKFKYLIADFYKCSIDDFPEISTDTQDIVTIVTNLGFQEGNDLPSRIGQMLSRITRKGDLVLSEMQLFNGSVNPCGIVVENKSETIRNFYHHDEMLRFSALVGAQFDESIKASFDWKSKYLFNLVPLDTEVGSVNVATTLVLVNINGEEKYVLTNSCLKYTQEQFKRAREATGTFLVSDSQETGDGSIVFQISERC